MNETFKTGEQHDDDVVKIRSPRIYWIWLLPLGGVCLVLATSMTVFARSGLTVLWLATGCLWVGTGLWIRTRGVDLTPESANVRGFRRRNIPWQDVQAVIQYRRHDAWGVRLILDSGEPVTLPAPTTWSDAGDTQYERGFHRIGQWWLAHRGEAWRPVRAEAPRLPAPGPL